MPRRPMVDPSKQRKHIYVMLPEREHAELVAAADRLRRPMSAIARDAINAYLVGQLTYYYVQTDAGFIPPPNEVGFLDFSQARSIAVVKHGQVVQRRWVPV